MGSNRLHCLGAVPDCRSFAVRGALQSALLLDFFNTTPSLASFSWQGELVDLDRDWPCLRPLQFNRLLDKLGVDGVLKALTAMAPVAPLACLRLVLIRNEILPQQICEGETQTLSIDGA